MSDTYVWTDFKLELVRGSDLHTVDHLDDLYEGTFDLALYGYGDTCSITLARESAIVTELLTGGNWYFKLWLGATHLRDYVLTEDARGYALAGTEQTHYVQFVLEPLDSILKWRYCEPAPGTTAFTIPTPPGAALTIDDAFKWAVDCTIGPNAFADPDAGSRVMAGFTVEANASAHATVRVFTEATRKNLFEFLQGYGAYYGVDWQVWIDTTTGQDNQFIFRTYTPRRGLDKTSDNGVRAPIIINDASANILTANYRRDYRFVNAVVSKSATDQEKDAASIAIYGRREMVSDTNNVVEMAALLHENAQKVGYDFVFEGSPSCMPLIDFVAGDLVTANNIFMGAAASDQTIRSIALHKKPDGQVDVTLTLGEYQRTLKDDITSGGGGGGAYGPPQLVFETDDLNQVTWNNLDPAVLYVSGVPTRTITTGVILNNEIFIDLAISGVMVGTYGNATQVAQVTVDAYGRITTAANVAISGVPPSAHNLLSAYHGDSTAAAVVRGDLATGQGAMPKWTRLAISAPAATYMNYVGAANGDAEPGYKALFDATVPTTIAESAIAAPGAAVIAARRDHTHGAPATWAATAHDLLAAAHGDTLAAAVSAGSLIYGNDTPKWAELVIAVPGANVRNVLGIDTGETTPGWKAALDATNPATLTVSAAAAPGTSLIFAHRDHVHPITSSADPGAAASILASDASGYLELVQLCIATTTNYLYSPGAGQIQIVGSSLAGLGGNGGAQAVWCSSTAFYPAPTNTLSCGTTGNRWSSGWFNGRVTAANFYGGKTASGSATLSGNTDGWIVVGATGYTNPVTNGGGTALTYDSGGHVVSPGVGGSFIVPTRQHYHNLTGGTYGDGVVLGHQHDLDGSA